MGILKQLLTGLGAGEAVEILGEHWDESEASFPAEAPAFLVPENIVQTRAFGSLPAAAGAELLEAARRIAASAELCHLAWHCQRLVYEHLDYEPGKIGQWPMLTRALGDLAGAFYLLIALAAIPRMRAMHAGRGIPERISRDTCSHYPESVRIYREHHAGRFGVSPRVLYWLRNHVKGDLYRLGRLEYMVKPFHGPLQAYRHRQTGETVALVTDGVSFDAEGLVAKAESPGAWCARFGETDEQVVGFPISPHGYAVRRRAALRRDEWERALAPGDGVLEVHIPAGGGMTLARCQESMRQALEFFPRYFPERPFSGFACGSWILNPQLEQLYRPDSNMVLWQRELYLFPLPSGDRSGIYFVFGADDVDPVTAPRDTSLRRALLDHLSAGGRLIGGGMFMLREDFSRFGTQVYRKPWPAVSARISR